jgi:hypothetical protein
MGASSYCFCSNPHPVRMKSLNIIGGGRVGATLGWQGASAHCLLSFAN